MVECVYEQIFETEQKKWKLEIFFLPTLIYIHFSQSVRKWRKSGLRKTVFSARRPLFRFAVFKADRTKKLSIANSFTFIKKILC